ncbi:MAG: histidine kinase [Muribaculaceae bacterium]|nr:histidine kinase [Muribaculaceae bacterium]
MTRILRRRRNETLIYAGLWLGITALLMLDLVRTRSSMDLPLIDMATLWRMVMRIGPLLLLFAVHNFVLIPRLLVRNRMGMYLVATGLLVALTWCLQVGSFSLETFRHAGPGPMRPHPGPRPLLPLPLFLDLVFDLFIIGINLAITLIFQRYEDRLEHERLLKTNAESQLTYLKAQINPHFYLNMLNNIHGMVELNPESAQEMIIEMSRLMRYMLYDSAQPRIALSAEMAFVKDYISLMRRRYPADKVRISVELPDESSMAGVSVPPLLFIVFIENAFKHGISYRSDSFVTVSLRIDGGLVEFDCLNSRHPDRDDASGHKGIGLYNVRRRLELLYPDGCTFSIHATAETYTVHLAIPSHETAHNNS